MDWLAAIAAALERATEPVEVFFRDDDVGWRDDRLLTLLDVFEAHAMPLDLAVIPMALHEDLAAELRAREGRIGVHQHGLAHRNHERTGRKHEFGLSRTRAQQRRDIQAGARRLHELLDGMPEPIFTPPWNRCTRDTGACLAELGYRVLSREWRAVPLALPGLQELPVRVDGLPTAEAIRPGRPVGIMLHHAIMDAEDMRRTDALLALLASHPRVRPRRMRECVSAARCA